MLSRLRSHFGRNVVGYIALFVALGGTSAYAANEWTGENIVDGSIKTADVANENLTGVDILNNSLRGGEIRDGYLEGIDVRNDSLKGADIDEASLEGVAGLERVEAASEESEAIDSVSPEVATAYCPSGKRVVGTGAEIRGGQSASNEFTDVVIASVSPDLSLTSVSVGAFEEEATAAGWRVIATAICAKAP